MENVFFYQSNFSNFSMEAKHITKFELKKDNTKGYSGSFTVKREELNFPSLQYGLLNSRLVCINGHVLNVERISSHGIYEKTVSLSPQRDLFKNFIVTGKRYGQKVEYTDAYVIPKNVAYIGTPQEVLEDMLQDVSGLSRLEYSIEVDATAFNNLRVMSIIEASGRPLDAIIEDLISVLPGEVNFSLTTKDAPSTTYTLTDYLNGNIEPTGESTGTGTPSSGLLLKLEPLNKISVSKELWDKKAIMSPEFDDSVFTVPNTAPVLVQPRATMKSGTAVNPGTLMSLKTSQPQIADMSYVEDGVNISGLRYAQDSGLGNNAGNAGNVGNVSNGVRVQGAIFTTTTTTPSTPSTHPTVHTCTIPSMPTLSAVFTLADTAHAHTVHVTSSGITFTFGRDDDALFSKQNKLEQQTQTKTQEGVFLLS